MRLAHALFLGSLVGLSCNSLTDPPIPFASQPLLRQPTSHQNYHGFIIPFDENKTEYNITTPFGNGRLEHSIEHDKGNHTIHTKTVWFPSKRAQFLYWALHNGKNLEGVITTTETVFKEKPKGIEFVFEKTFYGEVHSFDPKEWFFKHRKIQCSEEGIYNEIFISCTQQGEQIVNATTTKREHRDVTPLGLPVLLTILQDYHAMNTLFEHNPSSELLFFTPWGNSPETPTFMNDIHTYTAQSILGKEELVFTETNTAARTKLTGNDFCLFWDHNVFIGLSLDTPFGKGYVIKKD